MPVWCHHPRVPRRRAHRRGTLPLLRHRLSPQKAAPPRTERNPASPRGPGTRAPAWSEPVSRRSRIVRRRAAAGQWHERTLVIAPNWLGDCLMPATADAHRAQLATATSSMPGVAPLVTAHAEVSAVIEADLRHGSLDLAARWRMGRSLARRYTQAFILPNSWKSALVRICRRPCARRLRGRIAIRLAQRAPSQSAARRGARTDVRASTHAWRNRQAVTLPQPQSGRGSA